MAAEHLLRLEEVAQRLSISYTAVRELVLYEEAIPHLKVGVRGIRIREGDLEKYIAKSKVVKEGADGSQDDRGDKDTREPYTGRGILQGDSRRDKPPGVIEEDSEGSDTGEV